MVRKTIALLSALALGPVAVLSGVTSAGALASPAYADTVVSHVTTGSVPGGPTFGEGNVLGAPDGGPNDGWYNLGTGTGAAGTVVVGFSDNIVLDGAGNDLSVWEAHSFGATGVDQADVQVSQDGVHFTSVGTATDDPVASNTTYASSFDIASTGFGWIRYVKIVNAGDPSLDPGGADGFDLDAVEALHWSNAFAMIDSAIDDPLLTYAHGTKKPAYSVSGFVGDDEAGHAFGSLVLRDHVAKVTCTFVPGTGTFELRETSIDTAFSGDTTDVALDAASLYDWSYTCNNGDAGVAPAIEILDADAVAGTTTTWPGGAFALWATTPTTGSMHSLMVSTVAPNYGWVPLDRGAAATIAL